jgi:hypothetical protein
MSSSAAPVKRARYLFSIAAAALVWFAAAPLHAIKPDPTQGLDTQVDEIFEKLDTNRDGFIDRQEFGEKHAERFDKIDANGDGKIDRAEMKSWLQKKEDRSTRPGKDIRRGRGKSAAKT